MTQLEGRARGCFMKKHIYYYLCERALAFLLKLVMSWPRLNLKPFEIALIWLLNAALWSAGR